MKKTVYTPIILLITILACSRTVQEPRQLRTTTSTLKKVSSSAQDAASLKNHFKDTFLKMNSERKFEYLELLPYRQQPNVQRNSES